MNKEENSYLNLVTELIYSGVTKEDRTGVGTKSLFCRSLTFDLSDYKLPIMTHRKINYRNAIEEFLFMWRGHTQTKLLEEKKVNIWKGNTSKEFIAKKGLDLEEGDMGPMYGYNLRKFNGFYDQLDYLITTLKQDPNSRRLTMTTQDPTKRDLTVLDCCHGVWIQLYYNPESYTLDLSMTQRSCDIILGFPTNVIFYALMLVCISEIVNINPGRLIMNLNDVHIYLNHIETFKTKVLSLNPEKIADTFEFPHFRIANNLNNISDVEKLQYEDFLIFDYKHNPHIKFEMAV